MVSDSEYMFFWPHAY